MHLLMNGVYIMDFNDHYNLAGKHAFLSPSKYHWINYTEEKLIKTYTRMQAVERGTRLHTFACDAISLGIKLPKSKTTLNLYVNDAIGYRMTPEQPLYYSDNCFGTADAISFRKNKLRIHDLKTGASATSMHQLEIYTAIFCLEYNVNPEDIDIELRIYQIDEVQCYEPIRDDIRRIMNVIIDFDKKIEELEVVI
jgi:hypothetical protein